MKHPVMLEWDKPKRCRDCRYCVDYPALDNVCLLLTDNQHYACVSPLSSPAANDCPFLASQEPEAK